MQGKFHCERRSKDAHHQDRDNNTLVDGSNSFVQLSTNVFPIQHRDD